MLIWSIYEGVSQLVSELCSRARVSMDMSYLLALCFRDGLLRIKKLHQGGVK